MRFAECIIGPLGCNNKFLFCCVDFVEMWFRLWRPEEILEALSAGEVRGLKI